MSVGIGYENHKGDCEGGKRGIRERSGDTVTEHTQYKYWRQKGTSWRERETRETKENQPKKVRLKMPKNPITLYAN